MLRKETCTRCRNTMPTDHYSATPLNLAKKCSTISKVPNVLLALTLVVVGLLLFGCEPLETRSRGSAEKRQSFTFYKVSEQCRTDGKLDEWLERLHDPDFHPLPHE